MTMRARSPRTLLCGLLSLWALVACSDKAPSQSLEVAKQGVLASALSHNGDMAIIGSVIHGGSLWDLGKQERVYNWNHQASAKTTLLNATFSPEGEWALTTDDHTLVLWQTASGVGARFWQAPAEILDAALAADGNWALLGLADNTAVIFNTKRGGIVRRFEHKAPVRSVELSQDSKLAITGSEDNSAKVWDIDTSKVLTIIKHDEEVQLVTISPDGRYSLSASKYDKAIVWDNQTDKAVGIIPLHKEKIRRGLRLTAARFSDDGRYLLTGLPNRQIQLWQLPELTKIDEWTVPKRHQWQPTSAAITDVAFSRTNDTFIAIASNGYIHTLKR